MIINLSEAKTNLSRLVDLAYHGEKITIAKNNLPVADLVTHKPMGKRKLGLMKGKISVPDDFVEENSEINAMFYGEQ
jgi:prevent-host-death family protein